MATAACRTYASGAAALATTVAAAEQRPAKHGPRQLTLQLTQQPRPLFVSQVSLRRASVWSMRSSRPALLALFATELLVIDAGSGSGSGSSSSGGSSADCSVMGVYAWVSYVDVLDVVALSPSSLRITSTSTHALAAAEAAAAARSHAAEAGPGADDAVVRVRSSDDEAEATTTIRLPVESLELEFSSEQAAQSAAAALLCQRSQFAAAHELLAQGMHLGLRCDPVAVSLDGGVPWGPCPAWLAAGWGGDVPLPASWGALLDEAAGDTLECPEPVLEHLACPVELASRPRALQCTFTTPFGAAVATFTPQLVAAAMRSPQWREALGVPLCQGHGGARTAAFRQCTDTALGGGRTTDVFASVAFQVVARVGTPRQHGAPAQAAPGAQPAGPGTPLPSAEAGLLVLLAASLVCSLSTPHQQLLLLLLLLVLALAALAVLPGARALFRGQAIAAAAPGAAQPLHPFAAAAAAGTAEDAACCEWAIRLCGADVCGAPSRALQVQLSAALADSDIVRLRSRLASAATLERRLSSRRTDSSAAAAAAAAGALPDKLAATPEEQAQEEEALPVLVADPEPAWVTPDVKQRFLIAKATLAASRAQARVTHQWRQRLQVDGILRRPCPKLEALSQLMPVFMLADNTRQGHAVVAMKCGRVKELLAAVFGAPGSPPSLSLADLEVYLAFLNEYLTQVAAPAPLPGGFQVQVFDLRGFQLSTATSKGFVDVFKLLVKAGDFYPERMHLGVVLAPPLFGYAWTWLAPLIDANTRAKLRVVTSPAEVLPLLASHMGSAACVPTEFGGTCSMPLHELPAHQRMVAFGRSLGACC